MSLDSLGDYLSRLQDAGELHRLGAGVAGALELSAIAAHARRLPSGGPALFFENVTGHRVPVIASMYGSQRRLCIALEVAGWNQLERLGANLVSGAEVTADDATASARESRGSWVDSLVNAASNSLAPGLLPGLTPPGTTGPRGPATRLVRTAPSQAILQMGRDVDLWKWPIPRQSPAEERPTIVGAITLSADPETGVVEASWLTWELLDGQRLVPHGEPRDGFSDQPLFRHAQRARARGQQLAAALMLGGDPAAPILTCGRLPHRRLYPLLAALRGQPVEVARGRSVDLEVFAHAEAVIEAMLDPDAPTESLAVQLTDRGTARGPGVARVWHVTALTHRPNPVWPVITRGSLTAGEVGNTSEETWLRLAARELTLASARRVIPGLVAWHWPVGGQGLQTVVLAIDKTEPFAARAAVHALWGTTWIGAPRWITVVDATVDVRDEAAVQEQLARHADPVRDAWTSDGPLALDDPTSDRPGFGARLAVDATTKLPTERQATTGSTDREVLLAELQRQQVLARWSEFGLPVPLVPATRFPA